LVIIIGMVVVITQDALINLASNLYYKNGEKTHRGNKRKDKTG